MNVETPVWILLLLAVCPAIVAAAGPIVTIVFERWHVRRSEKSARRQAVADRQLQVRLDLDRQAVEIITQYVDASLDHLSSAIDRVWVWGLRLDSDADQLKGALLGEWIVDEFDTVYRLENAATSVAMALSPEIGVKCREFTKEARDSTEMVLAWAKEGAPIERVKELRQLLLGSMERAGALHAAIRQHLVALYDQLDG